MNIPSGNTTQDDDQKMFRTLRDDVKRGDFRRSVKREFAELKEFMLDDERKKRLSEMGAWRRWFVKGWWLFKSLFFKLTPARRILLVVGLLLIVGSRTVTFSGDHFRVTSDTNGVGILLVLFVLGLELKDKLVAKKELEAGRAIQQALMPERSPRVAGWELWLFTRSANEVGGDLVDFIRIDDQRVGVSLGDVAGKGLRAALLSAKLQATLRAIVADFSSLGALGTKLNTIFHRDSVTGIFASLVYVEIQPDSNTLRVLNAGHMPPFLVKQSVVVPLAKGDVALGIMESSTFSEHKVELERNEFMLIHSDGLTEAENMHGDFFGEKRLAELLPRLADLSAEQIGEKLVEEVDRFVGEARVHDDLSIVVLRRTS